MSISIDSVGDARRRTIVVTGELDISTLPDFRAALSEVQRQQVQRVEVDLSRTTFLDSTCIGALVSADQALRAEGGWLRVVGSQGMVKRALDLTGVSGLLSAAAPPGEDVWIVDGDDTPPRNAWSATR